MRYIVFSLFGNNPKYLVGAKLNLRLARKIYPDWKLVYYVDDATTQTSKWLKRHQAIIVDCSRSAMGGLYWRHAFPAHFKDAERYIVRDCDSRLSQREVVAVNEWILSGAKYHLMRDHPT